MIYFANWLTISNQDLLGDEGRRRIQPLIVLFWFLNLVCLTLWDQAFPFSGWPWVVDSTMLMKPHVSNGVMCVLIDHLKMCYVVVVHRRKINILCFFHLYFCLSLLSIYICNAKTVSKYFKYILPFINVVIEKENLYSKIKMAEGFL